MTPPAKVREALPGTISELAFRTGYPPETILKMLTRLRADGVAITAREDGISRSVGRLPDPEWIATTVYEELPNG